MKKISIKKIINISFGFTLLFFAYSCNNEDDVCISEKSETRFDIPQGNHDFDEQIVAPKIMILMSCTNSPCPI